MDGTDQWSEDVGGSSSPGTPSDGAAGGRVVVGVDGTPGGDAALRWARDEAIRRRDELVVVHVWSDLSTGDPPTPTQRLLREVAADVLAAAVASLGPDPGATVTSVLRRGRAAEELLDVASGADLLVVGTRGRGTVADLVLGSVSAACADRATGPVVIVPLQVPASEDETTPR
jgi:nucleotide-binding universal stress UspA family protein